MSSFLLSSQCQCAVVSLPNLPSIPPCVLREQFSSGYGLPKRSTLGPQSRASQFERLSGNFGSCSSSSSSSYGHSRIVWTGHLYPEAGSRGSHRVVSRAMDGSNSGDSVKHRGQRRALVRVISSWIVLPGLINGGTAFSAAAAEEDEQGPKSSTVATPPAKTLVERLLERSKANKAKYDQERLDAYYRRNFKDYFEFLKGSIENKDKEKLTEAEKGILSWLEKNQ